MTSPKQKPKLQTVNGLYARSKTNNSTFNYYNCVKKVSKAPLM